MGGVRGDRGGPVSPDVCLAGGEGGVGDPGRGSPAGVEVHVAAAGIAQVVLAVAVLALGDPAQPGVGAIGVDGQEEPLLKNVAVEDLTGADGGELGGEADAQVRLFEDVEKMDDAPPACHLGLEAPQVLRLGGGVEGGEADGAGVALGDVNPRQVGEVVVEQAQLGAHLVL